MEMYVRVLIDDYAPPDLPEPDWVNASQEIIPCPMCRASITGYVRPSPSKNRHLLRKHAATVNTLQLKNVELKEKVDSLEYRTEKLTERCNRLERKHWLIKEKYITSSTNALVVKRSIWTCHTRQNIALDIFA